MGVWLRFLAILWIAVGGALLAPAGQARTHVLPGPLAVAELPSEARDTLALIRRGGPFPYAKDGAVFGNFERRLPPRERGYYREYTVRTPGSRDRGARRIVTGGNPATAEYYYSDDHYRTFRRILE